MATYQEWTNEPSFQVYDEGTGGEETDCDEKYRRVLTERSSQDQGDEDEDEPGDAESDCSDDSDLVVDPAVKEDMRKFEETFVGIKDRFRLINRIGEGTFSTVYKAEDLLYEHYKNDWDIEEKENPKWMSPPLKKHQRNRSEGDDDNDSYMRQQRRPKFVAIKKIYVTSSPQRILNELDLLHDLRGFDSVCPLITAFRHTDQVVAVLPYFRHTDFREYFREMTVGDMQIYFRSLFRALAAVHSRGIIHRDIKPTNFLYEPSKRRGVLVDFGLAEREGYEGKPCLCTEDEERRRTRINNSVVARSGPSTGYPKQDSRPSRRANRAGTRGFRAPEVLLKCTDQSTKIDIWSAGVILLTILSRRFPFFNSSDDVEALIEIATIFGNRRMRQCALLHGTVLETNIPTIGASGFSFEKIILWSTCRNEKNSAKLSFEETLAVRFLERCLDLDPEKRISAEEALEHPFLREDEQFMDDDEINML